jgi:hypothetical protein
MTVDQAKEAFEKHKGKEGQCFKSIINGDKITPNIICVFPYPWNSTEPGMWEQVIERGTNVYLFHGHENYSVYFFEYDELESITQQPIPLDIFLKEYKSCG